MPPPMVSLETSNYCPGFKTYTEYNYLGSGLASILKTKHFEAALRLTRHQFGRAHVIDFGCCDGPFLPSLAKHFPTVTGIDINAEFIALADKVKQEANLANVQLFCSGEQSLEEIRHTMTDRPADIMFLLETLEHVGRREQMYESKTEFLEEISVLVKPGGWIVASVPKMVGPVFLLQRIGLWALRLFREPMSLSALLKSAILYNTDELENEWDGGHLGFNHRRLERALSQRFKIIKKKDLVFQMMYVIQAPSSGE